jgi:hypothetical protein
MKRCEHCGTQYADKVSTCPADGHLTINPLEQSRSVSSSALGLAAFDAKVVSPLLAAGSYQIFVQGSDWVFIQIESGSRTALDAVIPFLGPAGGIISLAAWLFSKRKTRNFQERLESDAPENLLRDSEKNFRLHLGEIRQAVIEPPPTLIFSGTEAGRITLTVRHGETLKLAFATREHLDAAWHLLKAALFSAVLAEVEWNAEKEKYQKPVRQKHLPQKRTALVSSHESQSEPAAYERAADQRGSRVLIRSRLYQTHCRTAVGFFVFNHECTRINTDGKKAGREFREFSRIHFHPR